MDSLYSEQMSINSPGYHSDDTDQCPGPINLSDFGGKNRRKSSEISPVHLNNLLAISVEERNSKTIISPDGEEEESEESPAIKQQTLKVAQHDLPIIKNFYHGLP